MNLTPCILPLIPVNLAIIGAGTRARSRGQGMALGAIYGLGMALAYGVLGVVVVLTGSKFGTLNSTPWFNIIIALLFAVLALGMFDVVNIDFSRFQSQLSPTKPGTRNRSLLAFSLGAVAALLAGACVAPVVISVLVMSTQLYGQGVKAGLALPFVLGLGMALPWPLAGAGLASLPKPGRWMTRVKHLFGVLILLLAVYYGHLGWRIFAAQRQTTGLTNAPAGVAAASTADADLGASLRQAREKGQWVLIDFSASWCKNCEAMEATVFNRDDVRARLQQFVVIRYAAEQPNTAPARDVLDHFGVLGLPAYVVLAPRAPSTKEAAKL